MHRVQQEQLWARDVARLTRPSRARAAKDHSASIKAIKAVGLPTVTRHIRGIRSGKLPFAASRVHQADLAEPLLPGEKILLRRK
jgi:hypothetical protein